MSLWCFLWDFACLFVGWFVWDFLSMIAVKDPGSNFPGLEAWCHLPKQKAMVKLCIGQLTGKICGRQCQRLYYGPGGQYPQHFHHPLSG